MNSLFFIPIFLPSTIAPIVVIVIKPSPPVCISNIIMSLPKSGPIGSGIYNNKSVTQTADVDVNKASMNETSLPSDTDTSNISKAVPSKITNVNPAMIY